jgi:hypothetical protein
MNTEESFKVRRRMMFAKGDDLYFFAYNLLIALTDLGCNTESKSFIDYRKLSFLIDFVSDPRLTAQIVEAKALGGTLNSTDRHELTLAYSRGASRQNSVLRLISALERKGFVTIVRSTRHTGFDLYLQKDRLPAGFLEDELYDLEKQNLAKLRSLFPQLRVMKLSTLLQQLFSDNGVEVWHA